MEGKRHSSFRYMKIVAASAAATFIISSCATIFSGTRAEITVMSPDARRVDLMVDSTQYGEVDLPKEVSVKRGFKPSIIRASAEGRVGEAKVRKSFNAISLINILLGGIPGFIIDCATGAITEPEMGSYTIYLNRDIQQSPHSPEDSE